MPSLQRAAFNAMVEKLARAVMIHCGVSPDHNPTHRKEVCGLIALTIGEDWPWPNPSASPTISEDAVEIMAGHMHNAANPPPLQQWEYCNIHQLVRSHWRSLAKSALTAALEAAGLGGERAKS